MKFAFVAINSQYIHSCLALQSLAELARPHGEVDFFDFTVNQDYRMILSELPESDIYFFSCYIWNRSMVRSLIADLKRVFPQAKVYVGGPEAQGTPDDFLHHGDGVFLGEGESALLSFLEGEVPPSFHTKDHPGKMVREDRLDFPYPFDFVDPKKICYYESQRGCPLHCSYCLSAEVDRLVDAPLGKVKEDLRRLVGMGIKLIKLVDRSFNAKPARCLELIEFFGTFAEDVTFHVELSPYGLSDAITEAIRQLPPGRIQVEIGFQALQPEVLQAIDRPAYTDGVLKRLEQFMTLPIHRHIDLIAGLPTMRLTDVADTFNYLFSLRPDDLQVGFLKLLPGTPLYRRRLEFGLVASIRPPYEVLRTPFMSLEEFNRLKQVAAMAHWFHPGDYPTTFKQLNLAEPFAFYWSLAPVIGGGEMSLEDRIRRIAEAIGDDTRKETLEIDYRRKRRHRKQLFFSDREVPVREILTDYITRIREMIPDLNDKRLAERISLYRTGQPGTLVLYDYATGRVDILEEACNESMSIPIE